MITIEEARKKYCIKINCGYCLTHQPILCCDPMVNIFIKNNGLEWCNKNIDGWKMNSFQQMNEDEVNKIFNIKNKKKKIYQQTLFDYIKEF